MACFPGPKTLPRNNSLTNHQDPQHPRSPPGRNPAYPSPLSALLTAAVSAGINHPPLPGCVWRSCAHRSRMAGMLELRAAGRRDSSATGPLPAAPQRLGLARLGTARLGTAWLCKARHGSARRLPPFPPLLRGCCPPGWPGPGPPSHRWSPSPRGWTPDGRSIGKARPRGVAWTGSKRSRDDGAIPQESQAELGQPPPLPAGSEGSPGDPATRPPGCRPLDVARGFRAAGCGEGLLNHWILARGFQNAGFWRGALQKISLLHQMLQEPRDSSRTGCPVALPNVHSSDAE